MTRQSTRLACAAIALLAVLDIAAAQSISLSLADAAARFDRRTGEAVVIVRLTSSSRQVFAEFTRNNVGRRIELLVDGRVVLAPVIREPIEGGYAQFAGSTEDEAKVLAQRLSAGEARLQVRLAEGN